MSSCIWCTPVQLGKWQQLLVQWEQVVSVDILGHLVYPVSLATQAHQVSLAGQEQVENLVGLVLLVSLVIQEHLASRVGQVQVEYLGGQVLLVSLVSVDTQVSQENQV